jgi:hypothetical protein
MSLHLHLFPNFSLFSDSLIKEGIYQSMMMLAERSAALHLVKKLQLKSSKLASVVSHLQ